MAGHVERYRCRADCHDAGRADGRGAVCGQGLFHEVMPRRGRSAPRADGAVGSAWQVSDSGASASLSAGAASSDGLRLRSLDLVLSDGLLLLAFGHDQVASFEINNERTQSLNRGG